MIKDFSKGVAVLFIVVTGLLILSAFLLNTDSDSISTLNSQITNLLE